MIKIANQTRKKIASIIAIVRIILLPTVKEKETSRSVQPIGKQQATANRKMEQQQSREG